MKQVNTLMIDDHPLILKGYLDVIRSFEKGMPEIQFQVEEAYSIGNALELLRNIFQQRKLHLVILDIGLPRETSMTSGLDLGVFIRKEHPESRIIVITSYGNYPMIQRLLGSVKPHGLLIKSEMQPRDLENAIRNVLDENHYYTETVRKYLTVKEAMPPYLDRNDLLILYAISEGKMTKELPNFLPLSLTAIERRKRNLKEILLLPLDCSDLQLINRAKEEGFV